MGINIFNVEEKVVTYILLNGDGIGLSDNSLEDVVEEKGYSLKNKESNLVLHNNESDEKIIVKSLTHLKDILGVDIYDITQGNDIVIPIPCEDMFGNVYYSEYLCNNKINTIFLRTESNSDIKCIEIQPHADTNSIFKEYGISSENILFCDQDLNEKDKPYKLIWKYPSCS